MKKYWVFLLVLYVCLWASGCSGGELEVLRTEKEVLAQKVTELETQRYQQSAWYKSEEFASAMRLFDDYLADNRQPSEVHEPDVLQVVRLDRISDRFFLVTYAPAPVLPATNYWYALADLEKSTCVRINPDTGDLISDVSYDQSTISFYCEGRNVFNGFRDFPHFFRYNLEKNEMIKEYVWHTLPYGEVETKLGNAVNKISLEKVTEKDKTMIFDFSQTDGMIMAGGNFCPAIRIGRKMTEAESRTVYIDFEAAVVSPEAEKQLKLLESEANITAVTIKHYKDVHDTDHSVVYFEFEGISEYSCRFIADENGFMDLMLLLK